MLRVSVTDLDQLRYFRASEDMELSELLARLRHETPQTPAMLAGIAFHKFLEHAGEMETAGETIDGHIFIFDVDATLSLPSIREIKTERQYELDGEQVTLVGKIDALSGRTVYDHKLTGRFDAERYADSYQWRCYLSMFGADKFIYNVFTGSEHPREPGTWRVYGFDQLPLYRYPMLETDVKRELRDYVAFCRQHLPEKFTQEAA